MSVSRNSYWYFDWNTKQMDEASGPSLSPCSLLTRREAASDHCHQSLQPKNQVTPFIRSRISGAPCIIHGVQADRGASEILEMARNTLSTSSWDKVEASYSEVNRTRRNTTCSSILDIPVCPCRNVNKTALHNLRVSAFNTTLQNSSASVRVFLHCQMFPGNGI